MKTTFNVIWIVGIALLAVSSVMGNDNNSSSLGVIAKLPSNMENAPGNVWVPASGPDAGKLHISVDGFYYGNHGEILQEANDGDFSYIAAHMVGKDIHPISRGQINGTSFSIIVPELDASYLAAAKDYFWDVDESAFTLGKDVLMARHIYFCTYMNGNDEWEFALYNLGDIGSDLRFTRNGFYTFIYSTGEVIIRGTGTYNGYYDCSLTEGWNCIYFDLAKNTKITIPLPADIRWICSRVQ